MKIKIPKSLLNTSLSEIKNKALDKHEGFALWLGRRSGEAAGLVTEVFVPEYNSGALFYRITDIGDEQLIRHLKDKKLVVLAQIHSHPEEAFHSKTDDELATVNYIGGLSFVVPDFGLTTDTLNFSKRSKVYKLEHGGFWKESSPDDYEVING
jgi:hypothetical protein